MDVEPTDQAINKPLVQAIVDRTAKVNPEWEDMPPVKDIWDTRAVEQLKWHLKNQKRDNCVPLQKKIEKIKEVSKPKDTTKEQEMAADESSSSEEAQVRVQSQVQTRTGKRPAQKERDRSAGDASPVKNVEQIAEETKKSEDTGDRSPVA